jgi:hypothetical protein
LTTEASASATPSSVTEARVDRHVDADPTKGDGSENRHMAVD